MKIINTILIIGRAIVQTDWIIPGIQIVTALSNVEYISDGSVQQDHESY